MAEDTKSSANEMAGLTEKSKFDAQKSPRPETNEQSQRPLAVKESIKSDRGTFQTK